VGVLSVFTPKKKQALTSKCAAGRGKPQQAHSTARRTPARADTQPCSRKSPPRNGSAPRSCARVIVPCWPRCNNTCAPFSAWRRRFDNPGWCVAVGPITQPVEKLKGLYEAGMRCARMNFSHGSHEVCASTVRPDMLLLCPPTRTRGRRHARGDSIENWCKPELTAIGLSCSITRRRSKTCAQRARSWAACHAPSCSTQRALKSAPASWSTAKRSRWSKARL